MKRILITLACILYVLSPIDLVPDILWIIGWLDDVAAIVLTVRQLSQGSTRGTQGVG
jgi:uncharacterized membrane protein YkvA (DUF1232 family)